jgi:hypothetical protein
MEKCNHSKTKTICFDQIVIDKRLSFIKAWSTKETKKKITIKQLICENCGKVLSNE